MSKPLPLLKRIQSIQNERKNKITDRLTDTVRTPYDTDSNPLPIPYPYKPTNTINNEEIPNNINNEESGSITAGGRNRTKSKAKHNVRKTKRSKNRYSKRRQSHRRRM